MGFETAFLENEKIIETRLFGDITNSEVLLFIDKMIELSNRDEANLWIVDYTNARYKLSTMEIFELPKKVSAKMEALGEKKNKIKRAIIRTQDISDFSFLEDVAWNNGQNLRVFSNRSQAIGWLKGTN